MKRAIPALLALAPALGFAQITIIASSAGGSRTLVGAVMVPVITYF